MIARKRALRLVLSLATLAALSAACAGGKPIDVGPPGDDDDDGGFDATFSNGAYPAIAQENCGQTGCHNAATASGGLQLPDSTATMSTSLAFTEITTGGASGSAVNTANPSASLILTKGAGTAHGGGVQWDDNDATYEAVLAWITAGAPNN